MGRGDEPHVDLHRLARADGEDLSRFEGAEELHLEIAGEVADLVEEEGAAVGLEEEALRIRCCPRERAPLVTEQRRLEERRRDRAAVHRDERRLRAPALLVDEAREDLLSRAGLAGEEDGDVARRGAGRERLRFEERRRAAERPACARRQRGLEIAHAVFEREPRVRAREHGREHVGVDRLREEVVGTAADQRERERGLPRARDDDDLRVGAEAEHPLEQLRAGFGRSRRRQHEVEDDEPRLHALEGGERVGGGACFDHVEAVRCENARPRAAEAGIVVDEEDLLARHRHQVIARWCVGRSRRSARRVRGARDGSIRRDARRGARRSRGRGRCRDAPHRGLFPS